MYRNHKFDGNRPESIFPKTLGAFLRFLPRHPMLSPEPAMDAEYEPFRKELYLAGLSEKELRSMDPDDRVTALEQAQLDPYDYIYLAC